LIYLFPRPRFWFKPRAADPAAGLLPADHTVDWFLHHFEFPENIDPDYHCLTRQPVLTIVLRGTCIIAQNIIQSGPLTRSTYILNVAIQNPPDGYLDRSIPELSAGRKGAIQFHIGILQSGLDPISAIFAG
jgi:hypothetical protein